MADGHDLAIGIGDIEWRPELVRRLAILTAALTAAVFVPAAIAVNGTEARIALLATSVIVVPAMIWIAHTRRTYRLSALAVVATFVAAGTVGFATLGFLSGPGIAFTAAVVFAGLLLGRRALILTMVFCAASTITSGALMVNGVIPQPRFDDISPALAEPWIRSISITLILILIIGSAVTSVVENIERANRHAQDEGERRRAAEVVALHAQSTQLISQLAASLAHDVNNHLTVIASWSELLTDDTAAEERAAANQAITHSIGEAAAMTKQLLMLGRRDAPVPQPVDLRAFLTNNTPMLDGITRDRVTFTVDVEGNPWCIIDPSRLGQVLINLVLNAYDATPDGGSVSIGAHLRTGGTGTGTSGPIPLGDWSVLWVQDTGSGMDPATQRRAFEPFFTTKRVGEGTGIGLATIAVIVEHAGGHFSLDSDPTRGTRIEVWLPAVDSQAPEHDSPRNDTPRLDGVAVLLVEDSVAVLDVARRALEGAGAIVTTALDAGRAIELTEASDFDLLCTDVVMPGRSVTDLIHVFEQRNPRNSVLLCSGFVGEELLRRGIHDGQYRLLEKPYTPDRLLLVLSELYANSSSAVPPAVQ